MKKKDISIPTNHKNLQMIGKILKYILQGIMDASLVGSLAPPMCAYMVLSLATIKVCMPISLEITLLPYIDD